MLRQLILFANFLPLMKIVCIQMYQSHCAFISLAWPEYIFNRYDGCLCEIKFPVSHSRLHFGEKTNKQYNDDFDKTKPVAKLPQHLPKRHYCFADLSLSLFSSTQPIFSLQPPRNHRSSNHPQYPLSSFFSDNLIKDHY